LTVFQTVPNALARRQAAGAVAAWVTVGDRGDGAGGRDVATTAYGKDVNSEWRVLFQYGLISAQRSKWVNRPKYLCGEVQLVLLALAAQFCPLRLAQNLIHSTIVYWDSLCHRDMPV
jgi:hypothetical protein